AGHPAAPIVVDRAFTIARDEALAAGPLRSPILEDEARLRGIGAHENGAAAAIVTIGIVPGIVVHEHAETNARGVVWIPGGRAHIAVAVVAQEAGIVVVLTDVVRDDVIVPVRVPLRDDALSEIGHRDVRIAADTAICDGAIVPVIAALDLVVDERVCRGD